jgi:hypothetical protein
MLVVTVDLAPGGYEPYRRNTGSMRIINVSNLAEVPHYDVAAMEGANALTGHPPWRRVTIASRASGHCWRRLWRRS